MLRQITQQSVSKATYVLPTWAERFGAQTVHHLADVSHWPPLEAPQDVAQKLTAFFG